jgi:hypothetical protein
MLGLIDAAPLGYPLAMDNLMFPAIGLFAFVLFISFMFRTLALLTRIAEAVERFKGETESRSSSRIPGIN